MKLVLQSTQLPLRSFRQLSRHLGIAHPLLAVEVDHLCVPKTLSELMT
jgi:hypothetical protein